MSDLRQAAQQALEALEERYVGALRDKAIDALESALAEPEQEPVAWSVINPEGQVVATAKDAIHGWACLGGFKPTLEGLLGFHDQGWRVVPSTAPPQRKPLTDQQIEALDTLPFYPSDADLIAFARRIEQAHGIK